MRLSVYIEKQGKKVLVGVISGDAPEDSVFTYDEKYMEDVHSIPVSISLPFRNDSFSPVRTRAFFEGLLPEGFTKREVARHLKVDENDYLQILSALGNECIGAIQIIEEGGELENPYYEELTTDRIQKLASEGATSAAGILTKTHLSLAGASGKVGLYYDDKSDKWFLPHGDAPSTHIVKQSHVRLANIVINERLVLLTAKGLGIDVPVSFILDTGRGKDDEILFATARYDRAFDETSIKINNLPRPLRLHQEDFAQAMGISSDEKYESKASGYMGKMFDVIRQNSASPIDDQNALWDRIVFNYLIGNTDAHIKNFSLLYDTGLTYTRLAPSYDMISTVVYEESTRDMSFFIGGEKNLDRIDTACFERAAEEAGVGKKIAIKRYDYLRKNVKPALEEAKRQLLEEGFEAAETIYRGILKNAPM